MIDLYGDLDNDEITPSNEDADNALLLSDEANDAEFDAEFGTEDQEAPEVIDYHIDEYHSYYFGD